MAITLENVLLYKPTDRKTVGIIFRFDNGWNHEMQINTGCTKQELIRSLRDFANQLAANLNLQEEPRVAPWRDWRGNVIREGDVIVHPGGDFGKVIVVEDSEDGHKWQVDYGGGTLSPLCLQIKEKGRAVVVRE